MNFLDHLRDLTFWRLKLFGLDLSLTHSTVFVWSACLLVIIPLWLIGRRAHFIPTRSQSLVEMVVNFLRGEFEPVLGEELPKWLGFLLALFFFIWVSNLTGLFPGFVPPTSNLNVTATLALIVFFTCQIAGVHRKGLRGYLRDLVPQDLPIGVKIVFAPIELISQIARPFSLAIRLFANMYAGQVVILALVFLIVFFRNPLIAPLPVLGAAVVHIFEIFIATIQAYIFTYLTALYIGEAVLAEN